MIKELTKQQKEQFSVYVKKWTDIGLCTEPANRVEAEKGIIKAYRIAGMDAPKIVWCGSPLGNILTKKVMQKLNSDSVYDSVSDSVRNSVRNSVSDSVCAPVYYSVYYSVCDSVRNSVYYSIYGQHESPWLSFYDYFREVCGLKKETEKLSGLIQIAQNAGWLLPCKNICFISERHNVCKLKDGKIHCDGGPAIQYPDGFSVWGLNGVRVPQWLAETRDTEIDPEKIFEINNAEVRREFVRKVGIDRIIHKLHAQKIDTQDGQLWSGETVPMYELLVFNCVLPGKGAVGGSNYKYLKMVNPSLSTPDNFVYHIEGVGPHCKTVQDALLYRLNGDSKKYTFDPNGVDWKIHGDVIIIPKGKTKLKPQPSAVA